MFYFHKVFDRNVWLVQSTAFACGYETNKLKIENPLEKSESAYNKNSLELSSIEKFEVEKIFKDIENSNINSYEALINKSRNFSESQKVTLINTIGKSLEKNNHGQNDLLLDYGGEPVSHDDYYELTKKVLENSRLTNFTR